MRPPTHPTGAAMPAGTHLHRLAASLARPVARGWLSPSDAMGSLAAFTFTAKRKGGLGPYKPEDVFGTLCHTLDQRLKSETERRELARLRIRRLLRPMIGTRKPWRALMAEAHGLNGEAAFPLTEGEVGDVVREEVWWSLPAGGRRRG